MTKVAILSDIHDHVSNLSTVLRNVQDADALICCGDLCSPFIVDQLATSFVNRPIHIVFGNNDGDQFRMTKNADRYSHVHIHGAFFADIFDGKSFAVNHYNDIALAIAASQTYDVVCYGHNHLFKIEPVGTSLAINPGAVMGYNPVSKQNIAATYVIYDTVAGKAEGFRVASAGQGNTSSDILPYPGEFQTLPLPEKYDYLAPDESEIRTLASIKGGGLAHCTLPPNGVSLAVVHQTVEEVWYFLEGRGEVWRKWSDHGQVDEVGAGMSLNIPLGTHFQFRNMGRAPLRFLVATIPSWPGAQEAVRVEDHWPVDPESTRMSVP